MLRTRTVPTTVHTPAGPMEFGLRHTGPDGPVRGRVLLIAGTGQPAQSWDRTERALAEAGFEVLAYSARGIVPSSAPPLPWSVDDLVDDALAVLDHQGWREPVTVVGFSLGGFTTEQLARRAPGRVHHAVLVAGHRHASAVARAASATRMAVGTDRRALDALDRFETFVTMLPAHTLAHDPVKAGLWWDVLGLRARTWSADHAPEGQAQASAAWMEHTPEPAALPPFTLLCFADDLLMPAGEPARTAARELGDCPVVELPGGHGGLFTDPEAFGTALVEVVSARCP